MKRYIFSILMISALLVNYSYAQTEKGNFLLGGSLSFNDYKTESTGGFSNVTTETNTKQFNFSPAVSYFLMDNLSVGLIFPVSKSKTDNGQGENKQSFISIGPKVRYYFMFDNVGVFPELNYSLGNGKYNGQMFDPISGSLVETEFKYDMSMLKLGLGFAYFLNKNISAELILSYKKQNQDYPEGYTDNEYSSKSVDFGFQIYFNRGSE